MALLKVDALTVVIDERTVVEDVSLAIGKGQRLALIGPDASGKSMVLDAVAGLLPPGATSSGSMSFDDQPMPMDEADRRALRGRRIAVLADHRHSALLPLQTVGRQIGDALTRAGAEADKAVRPASLLAEVGLDAHLAALYPDALSVLDRRRALVAIALAGSPDLLIADNPTAGLDAIEQKRVLDLIMRRCTDAGMSLLFSASDLKTVALLATKVAVLKDGRVVEAGEKQDVFGHPRHPVTHAILSAGRHRGRTLMRTPIGDTLIDVRKVSRSFPPSGPAVFNRRAGTAAVDTVSFSIRAGESVALLGPAGAGKSTLAKIVAGLERTDAGELELEHAIYHGRDLPRLLRHEIAYVFADPRRSFNPRYTVGESIAEPLQLEMQKSVDELGTRLLEVVRAVGLSADVLTRLPASFGTDGLQRLALARALAARPRLVVLDEPIEVLDIAARGDMLVLLNRLRADYGLSFLVATRSLEIVRSVADRVLVMDRGRIVEATTPAQLLEKPNHPVSQELVAAQLPDVGIVPVF